MFLDVKALSITQDYDTFSESGFNKYDVYGLQ